MNDRIRACLDGELPREALSPDERVELGELKALIGRIAHELRLLPAPDLTAPVMERIRAASPERVRAARARTGGGWARALRWLWRERTVRLRLRPAYGLGFAALLTALIAWPARPVAPAGPTAGRPGERPEVYVQFRLEAAGATRVALAGNFTGWEPRYELREGAPGVWSIVLPLHPGVHDYAFVVDGTEWVADPYAPGVADGFGGMNSRISLLPPDGSRSL